MEALKNEYNRDLDRFVEGEYNLPNPEMAARAAARLQQKLATLKQIFTMGYGEFVDFARND